jgi:hypothetical protein
MLPKRWFVSIVFYFITHFIYAGSLPSIVSFVDAKMVRNDLFVLAKNHKVYRVNVSSGASNKAFEKENILGIFQLNDTMYAWNDFEVFCAKPTGKGWVEVLKKDDSKYIKCVSSFNNELVIAYLDQIYFPAKNKSIKTSFVLNSVAANQGFFGVTKSKIVYELNKQLVFEKVVKLDSAIKVFNYQNNLIYTTKNGVRIYNQTNKSTHIIDDLKPSSKIFDVSGEQILALQDNLLSSFNVQNNQLNSINNLQCNQVKFVNKNTVLYNDQNGHLILMNTQNGQQNKIQMQLKPYLVVSYFNEDGEIAVTKEGFVLSQEKGGSGYHYTDVYEETGTLFNALKIAEDNYVLAAEKGLFLFNTNGNTCQAYKYLNNIMCNDVAKNDKFLFIASVEGGIYKMPLSSSINIDKKPSQINEGLFNKSAYLIRNVNGLICSVSSTGVYKKNGSSDSWTEFSQSAFVSKISGLTYYNKKNVDVLFISSLVRGIIKTNDKGLTYETLNAGLKDTAISKIEADSNGFIVLNKSGELLFHAHDGVEWVKLESGNNKIESFFLENGCLNVFDEQKNLVQLFTHQIKPGIEVNWDERTEYHIGEKITIPYKLFGFYGKNNYAVLQLTQADIDFDENFVKKTKNLEGVFELLLTDSLTPPGDYILRVVGTDPFVPNDDATKEITVLAKNAEATKNKDLELKKNTTE